MEIAAADVKQQITDATKVEVTLPAGDQPGTGTLTLVFPLGGTEVTSVTVN